MTTIAAFHPARPGPRRHRIAQILDRLRTEARIRRDTRHLSEMDDHMLRDIGLYRGDIPLAVRFGRHT